MKIYVASKFENVGPVRKAMALLKEHGHEITHDWTVNEEKEQALRVDLLKEFLHRCAVQDLHGVVEADALILLNHPDCKGAFVEMGAAIALGKPVIVVDSNRCNNIFFHLDSVHHADGINHALFLLDQLEPREETA